MYGLGKQKLKPGNYSNRRVQRKRKRKKNRGNPQSQYRHLFDAGHSQSTLAKDKICKVKLELLTQK